MSIIIIAAVAENNVIGKSGKIPWHISEDFKLFKRYTAGNTVIMGRKTFESLGMKPLPNRNNIVISSKLENIENVDVCKSFEEALKLSKSYGNDIFIIGGARLYEEALSVVDKLYISHVKGEFDGDTFFPEIDRNKWNPMREEKFDEFTFVEYERICNV